MDDARSQARPRDCRTGLCLGRLRRDVAFWVSFVVFLASPHRLLDVWPLPTVAGGLELTLAPMTAAAQQLSLSLP